MSLLFPFPNSRGPLRNGLRHLVWEMLPTYMRLKLIPPFPKGQLLRKASFVRKLIAWTGGNSVKEQNSNPRFTAFHHADRRLQRSRLGTIQPKMFLGIWELFTTLAEHTVQCSFLQTNCESGKTSMQAIFKYCPEFLYSVFKLHSLGGRQDTPR